MRRRECPRELEGCCQVHGGGIRGVQKQADASLYTSHLFLRALLLRIASSALPLLRSAEHSTPEDLVELSYAKRSSAATTRLARPAGVLLVAGVTAWAAAATGWI